MLVVSTVRFFYFNQPNPTIYSYSILGCLLMTMHFIYFYIHTSLTLTDHCQERMNRLKRSFWFGNHKRDRGSQPLFKLLFNFQHQTVSKVSGSIGNGVSDLFVGVDKLEHYYQGSIGWGLSSSDIVGVCNHPVKFYAAQLAVLIELLRGVVGSYFWNYRTGKFFSTLDYFWQENRRFVWISLTLNLSCYKNNSFSTFVRFK